MRVGGKGILLTVAGKDATVQFNSLHKPTTLDQYLPKLQVGVLAGAAVEKKKEDSTCAHDCMCMRARVASCCAAYV